MLIFFREAILSLIQKREIIFYIILIAGLNFINYLLADKNLRIIIWCFEYFILTIAYITILENEIKSLKDNFKNAIKILPRFTGLFIYFGITILLLVVTENTILQNNVSYKNEIIGYVNIILISIVFSPFYLYAPIYLISKNAFVYESIREGFKFIVLKPVFHSIPSFIVTAISLFKYQSRSDHYIIFIVNQIVFLFTIFYSINLANILFQKRNINYVSLKSKIEEGPLKKKNIFEIRRGKWE